MKKESWAELLPSFSAQHEGWLVAIDSSDYEPLVQISLTPEGAIEIVTTETTRRVDNPSAITIREASSEAVQSIRIDSPSGPTTVRFRSAVPPLLVDGI